MGVSRRATARCRHRRRRTGRRGRGEEQQGGWRSPRPCSRRS